MKSHLVLILTFLLSSLPLAAQQAPIVIGSKEFTENYILGEMAAILLKEKYNQPVERKLGLGGTKVAFDALANGSIDLYPDYTGTGYIYFLKRDDDERDPDKIYKIVQQEFKKRFNMVWSPPFGFNNTYALAVRANDERLSDLMSTSELVGSEHEFTLAAPHEFMERSDGLPNFQKAYGLNFPGGNLIGMEAGLTYSAIRDEKVDIIVSYSTDGRISGYNLRLIEDDLNFFPPYYAAWLTKAETLQKYPVLKQLFSDFDGLISEREMIELNNQVDTRKREPENVARNFLVKKGLLEGKLQDMKGVKDESLLSYFYKKKKYLYRIMKEHLVLSFGSLLLALLVSLPTGIALTRFPMISTPVFTVVNTIQTIPSLALLGFLIPILGIGKLPGIVALFLYSLLPLVRNTYTGIHSVDKSFIEASRGIGLTNWQILWRVEIPLAMPVILAGIRTASVIVIGTATLAALVGAGGLGDPIFRGVATVNNDLIFLGAIPSALLAIVTDKLLALAETKLVSKGLTLKR